MTSAMNAKPALLSVDQLHAHYGKSHILHGVTFDVKQGEVVSLLGRNGSGRSTTMKALMGLVPPTGGSVHLQGRALMGQRPYTICRAGLAYVPEEREVFTNLTVDENLRMGEQSPVSGAVTWTIDQMFDYFPRLKERRKQLAGYLSGGEQQMLAIGRAIVGQPRLILLDEPSLGLAPLVVKDIFEIIARINREQGVAMLLVEQNAMAAFGIAHYGYIMESGRIVIDGPSDKLVNDPDVQRFYLGYGDSAGELASFRDIKHYKRRKRWLS